MDGVQKPSDNKLFIDISSKKLKGTNAKKYSPDEEFTRSLHRETSFLSLRRDNVKGSVEFI